MDKEEFMGLAPVEELDEQEQSTDDTTHIDDESIEETDETITEDEDVDITEPSEPIGEQGIQQPTKQPNESNTNELQARLLQMQQRRQQSDFDTEYRAAIGQQNPFNGKIVQSVQDFFEYKRDFEQHNAKASTDNFLQKVQSGDVSSVEFEEYIRKIIEGTPAVKEAQIAKQKAEQIEAQAKIEAGKARLQADIDAYTKENPSCIIKTVTDIENNPKVMGYISKGLSFDEAYYLAYRNEMTNAKVQATKQAVLNNTVSKEHLKTTKGGGATDAIIVPEEVKAQYRVFFPGWSDARIVQDYIKRM